MNKTWIQKHGAAIALLGIASIYYLLVVMHYAVNVPFWDDFSVILEPLDRLFEATASQPSPSFNWMRQEVQNYLFLANAGHVPMITHAVALIQALYFGGVDFRWAVIVGDVGLIFSALLLVGYGTRKAGLPLMATVPVALLLYAIVHWEAMDFMVPAWQFYWGAVFFPLLVLMVVVEQRWILAAIAFSFSLFLFAGATILYPLVIGYGLLRRQWWGVVQFGVLSALSLWLYFHFMPPQDFRIGIPGILTALSYVARFMGSILPAPTGYLEPYASFHLVLGILVILAALYCFIRVPGLHACKLIILYIIVLGIMAVCTRGFGGLISIPSRYSLFSLMSFATVYVMLASQMQARAGKAFMIFSRSAVVLSLLLCVYSAAVCVPLLEINHKGRVDGWRACVEGRVPDTLVWNPAYGRDALDRAANLGVYTCHDSTPASPGKMAQ